MPRLFPRHLLHLCRPHRAAWPLLALAAALTATKLLHAPILWSVLAVLSITCCAILPLIRKHREALSAQPPQAGRKTPITFNIPLIIFTLWGIIPLIFVDTNPFYHPIERYIYFLLAMLLLSPLWQSPAINLLRRYLLFTILAITGAKVLYWFGEFFITTLPGIIQGQRTFFRAFPHGIAVGHAIAIVIPFLLFMLFRPIRNRPLCILIWATSIITLLLLPLANSRGAIIATFVAIIILTLLNRTRQALRFWIILAALATIFLAVDSQLNLTATIHYKFDIGNTHSSLTFSRDKLWLARVHEFLAHPITGIGIGQVTDFSHPMFTPDQVRALSHCEPGNAYLGILAQLGLPGLLLFLLFLISLRTPRAYHILHIGSRHAVNLPDGHLKPADHLATCNSSVVITSALWAELAALLTLGIFEGFLLAPGNPMFSIFWLTTAMLAAGRLTPHA